MDDNTIEPFGFPAIGRKKVAAAFDDGRLTSDGGVLLLAAAERQLGLCDRLAALISDPRDPSRVVHPLADILRARILAIACGYEDADDLDHLRRDPGVKLACGRLPDTGRDLCSQPTMSRWENAPSLREVIRLMQAMVDLYCASYPRPPECRPSLARPAAMVGPGRQAAFVALARRLNALLRSCAAAASCASSSPARTAVRSVSMTPGRASSVPTSTLTLPAVLSSGRGLAPYRIMK
jgi:hypothetical protein